MVDPRRPHAPMRPTPPQGRAPASGPKRSSPARPAADPSRPAKPKAAPKVKNPANSERAAKLKRGTVPKSNTVAKKVTKAAAPKRGASPKPQSSAVRTRERAKGRPDLPRPTVTHDSAGTLARATSSIAERAHRPSVGSPTPPSPWERVSATGSNVTTRMQERLRERRSAQTRLSALKWAKRLGVVALAAGVVWLVSLSPVFALDPEATQTTGFGSVVSPEQVAEVIAAHEGTSLMLLNTGQVSSEIEALVGVREVQITRVWPAGLRVEILSSEPVAAIPQGAAFLLVDDLGETVDTADAPPEQLPVITIPVGEGSKRILAGVLEVVDEIPVTLRDRVEGIEAQTEDSISFVLRDGPRVEWGSGEQSALKAEVLAALLDSEQTAGVDVIDVSAPSLPITNRE